MIEFDLDRLTGSERYKLLTASVVPRPIALVTTRSPTGIVNAAPFSYFNVMGTSPAVVAIGVGDRGANTPKDTARNIRDGGEFVINLVDEALAEQMVLCAVDFPPELGEPEALGLELVDGRAVAVPRLAASPIHLECRHHSTVEIGKTRIILGQVVRMHFRDDLIDTERMYVQTEAAALIGRMHGRGWYAKTDSRIEIERIGYATWLERRRDE